MAVGAAENADSAGMRLARARARLALSVEEVADQLKLDPHTIVALEAGDHRAIGATVFVRGFLRRYAALVGESPAEIEALYARHPDAEFQPDLSKTGMHRIAPASYRPKIRPWPAVVAALALVATGTAWWALRSRPASVAPAPASQPFRPPRPARMARRRRLLRRRLPVRRCRPMQRRPPAAQPLRPASRRRSCPGGGACAWPSAASAGPRSTMRAATGCSLDSGTRARPRNSSGVPPFRVVLANVEAVTLAVEGVAGAPAGQCARRARARHARRQRRRHGLALGSAGAGPFT